MKTLSSYEYTNILIIKQPRRTVMPKAAPASSGRKGNPRAKPKPAPKAAQIQSPPVAATPKKNPAPKAAIKPAAKRARK